MGRHKESYSQCWHIRSVLKNKICRVILNGYVLNLASSFKFFEEIVAQKKKKTVIFEVFGIL